jgi:hypothetical protein
VSGSALSARATARLVAVCAVLAGLFFMHGLPAQERRRPRGVRTVDGAPGNGGHFAGAPDMAAGAMAASVRHPLPHPAAEVGADAGEPGALCMSTPPPLGWAGLLALLLGVSIVGLVSVPGPPDRATRPSNPRRRAPPRAGSTLLMNLCVSRR